MVILTSLIDLLHLPIGAEEQPYNHSMTDTEINSLREQIQTELIKLFEERIQPMSDGDPWMSEHITEVMDHACQIVVDNFNKFKSKE